MAEQTNIEEKDAEQNYRGKRKNIKAGPNSKRFDVVYKTLLRSLRRFLWQKFLQHQSMSYQNEGILTPNVFKDTFEQFYQSNLSKAIAAFSNLSAEQEHSLKYALSILMTNRFYIKRESYIQRNLSNILSCCLKGFTAQKYKSLFRNEGFSLLFQAIVKTNIIDDMIETYEHLKISREAYHEAVKKIAEYRETNVIMFSV